MTRILVTGAGGMVGSYVPDVFTRHEQVLTDIVEGYRTLDVRDRDAVARTIADVRPDVVLHLAAATDVDRCQLEPDWAHATNAAGTENVARACRSVGAVMVYVSTGAVFPGDRAEPYAESDATGPVNTYAHAKLAGEQAVATLLERHLIVRAGWMFGGGRRDTKFVGKIAQLVRAGRPRLEAVDDKVGSPTYARDFLRVIQELLDRGRVGLYHGVNVGVCSRFDMAVAIRDALERPDVAVAPVSSDRFPLPAPRGYSEAMRNVRLELLGMKVRSWEEALGEYVNTALPGGDAGR
jgi:dTDP-4-dehydrorhamnose reductase